MAMRCARELFAQICGRRILLAMQVAKLRHTFWRAHALVFTAAVVALSTVPALRPVHAQGPAAAASNVVWQMHDSGTTASLRGIHSVDGQIAWASGTGSTVLKTTDGGVHWERCAIPDGEKDGATLDFRGVQAWDAETAIVMASGPGEKSRLYKTTDGCKTWKLVFKNPDKDGFWDAVRFFDRAKGVLIGDSVSGKLYARMTDDGGERWHPFNDDDGLKVGQQNAGFFAASNSCLMLRPEHPYSIEAVANAGGSAEVYFASFGTICSPASSSIKPQCHDGWDWDAPEGTAIPSNGGSRGVFSLGWAMNQNGGIRAEVIAGGDYTKPNDSTGTAAWTADGGLHWTASATPPHGYRSSVQWSEPEELWITAGTNGSDISRDDGRTWQPLDDGNWNALSLPFVVGPKGRIARLNPSALPKP
jgi:hypothetical protein